MTDQYEAATGVGEHRCRNLAGKCPVLDARAGLTAETHRRVPDGLSRVGDVDERGTQADFDLGQTADDLAYARHERPAYAPGNRSSSNCRQRTDGACLGHLCRSGP